MLRLYAITGCSPALINNFSVCAQQSTYWLLNVCFAILLLPELFMLRYAIHKGEAIGHVCVLIVLSIGVFVAINWRVPEALSAHQPSVSALSHFSPLIISLSHPPCVLLCAQAHLPDRPCLR